MGSKTESMSIAKLMFTKFTSDHPNLENPTSVRPGRSCLLPNPLVQFFREFGKVIPEHDEWMQERLKNKHAGGRVESVPAPCGGAGWSE